MHTLLKSVNISDKIESGHLYDSVVMEITGFVFVCIVFAMMLGIAVYCCLKVYSSENPYSGSLTIFDDLLIICDSTYSDGSATSISISSSKTLASDTKGIRNNSSIVPPKPSMLPNFKLNENKAIPYSPIGAAHSIKLSSVDEMETHRSHSKDLRTPIHQMKLQKEKGLNVSASLKRHERPNSPSTASSFSAKKASQYSSESSLEPSSKASKNRIFSTVTFSPKYDI